MRKKGNWAGPETGRNGEEKHISDRRTVRSSREKEKSERGPQGFYVSRRVRRKVLRTLKRNKPSKK